MTATARSIIMIIGTTATLACAAGGQSTPVPAVPRVRLPRPGEYFTADSVVLERGPCFGTCPVYRVTMTRTGGVHFVSLDTADTSQTISARVDPRRFTDLMGAFAFSDFFALPDTIERDRKYCPAQLTDQPTVTVSLFLPGRTKQVVDYYGCAWAPWALRNVERAIDEATGSAQWARPAPF
jgi:hypothetical protein